MRSVRFIRTMKKRNNDLDPPTLITGVFRKYIFPDSLAKYISHVSNLPPFFKSIPKKPCVPMIICKNQ